MIVATNQNHIKTNSDKRFTISSKISRYLHAAGYYTTIFRAVFVAAAAGNKDGTSLNQRELLLLI